MTVPAGTFQSFQAVGNAEDFEDLIYDITPRDTPLLTLAKRMRAENKTHNWQTDELKAHTAGNAVIEGDDAGADTAVPTVNLKNHIQHMEKVPKVSDVQEAITHYGRDSEMEYQMAKRAAELKKDLEAALCQNNAATVGAAASAPLMASLESWLAFSGGQAATIKTANGTSVGSSDQTTPGFTTANAVPLTAPTDATVTGTLTETHLKDCIANTYSNGGDPSIILVPPLIKKKISTSFAGISTRFRAVNAGQQAEITGGADLYVSDFGDHQIKPSRVMRTRTLFGIDPKYIGVAYLIPFTQRELSRTGHARKRLLTVSATLVVKNPFAHFKIADINPAL